MIILALSLLPITHHAAAESVPQVLASVLKPDVPDVSAVEALGEDCDHTDVDEQRHQQCSPRFDAEEEHALLLQANRHIRQLPGTRK